MAGSGAGTGTQAVRQVNDVSCPSICTWLPASVPVRNSVASSNDAKGGTPIVSCAPPNRCVEIKTRWVTFASADIRVSALTNVGTARIEQSLHSQLISCNYQPWAEDGDLKLLYEVVQPDGTTDTLSASLPRAIGLVGLGGDDPHECHLRLVQGSALDRLLPTGRYVPR